MKNNVIFRKIKTHQKKHFYNLDKKNCNISDFWPRWRHRYTHCASSHNQREDNNKFKNKKQPELTENQTVWKSDNQGVKEETFILTCRRGGEGQLGGEDSRQRGSWWTRQGGGLQAGWSHILVQINREEQLGSKTDHATQGSSSGK